MRDFLIRIISYIARVIAAFNEVAVNYQCASAVTMGLGGRFFKQATVVNMQQDKSKIRIGNNARIRGELLVFPYGGEIQLGDLCYIGEGTKIWSGEKIVIGDHVAIAHNVNIVDFAHETDYLVRAASIEKILTVGHPKEKGDIPTAPIVIQDYVAIYPNVSILRGVTIGEGAVISAGSVVMSDVPPFSLMLGNPARQLASLKK